MTTYTLEALAKLLTDAGLVVRPEQWPEPTRLIVSRELSLEIIEDSGDGHPEVFIAEWHNQDPDEINDYGICGVPLDDPECNDDLVYLVQQVLGVIDDEAWRGVEGEAINDDRQQD